MRWPLAHPHYTAPGGTPPTPLRLDNARAIPRSRLSRLSYTPEIPCRTPSPHFPKYAHPQNTDATGRAVSPEPCECAPLPFQSKSPSGSRYRHNSVLQRRANESSAASAPVIPATRLPASPAFPDATPCPPRSQTRGPAGYPDPPNTEPPRRSLPRRTYV